MTRRKRQRGSTLVEFALTGIPLIFMWISIVQMGIGMWNYHTLHYALKAAGAYMTVHGTTCAAPNTCSIQIKDAAQVLANNAIGLPRNAVQLTFTSVKSDHVTAAAPVICQLDACLTDATAWPPAGYGTPGSDIEIKAEYLFHSALAMVAPGPGAGAVGFGAYWLPAYTHQMILF